MRAYRYLADKGVFVNTGRSLGSRILAVTSMRMRTSTTTTWLHPVPGLRKTYEWRIQRAAQGQRQRR
jgi:hypothetical protein